MIEIIAIQTRYGKNSYRSIFIGKNYEFSIGILGRKQRCIETR